MAAINEIISFSNPLCRTYVFYCSVLALKMLAMSILTGTQRFKKGAFSNPEDIKGNSKAKVRVDEDVERVRRAHLNDLENIPVFMIISGLYLLTDPTVFATTMLFRLFTLVRIAHTVVYAIVVLPQPSRGLSWGIGYGITIYMGVSVLLSFISAM